MVINEWLKKVDGYIATLEEDLDYLNKENGQLRAKIERLRAALRTILNYLDEDEEPVWYNIARRALDDD